jgi:hypothetical protein
MRRDREEREKERDELINQAEAARTRGTPLTPQAFQEWRIRFTNELKQKREKEEDERIRALPPKEREDVRKRRERLSGKSCSSSNPSSFSIIYWSPCFFQASMG